MARSPKGNMTESGRDLPDWMLPEAEGRHWYGRKRKPAYRKATPKGGYDRYRGYDALDEDDEFAEVAAEGVDMPLAILVLGVVALVLSFVPLIRYVAVVFAIATVILATREFTRLDPAARIRLKGKDVRDQRLARLGRFLAIIAIVSVAASTIWGIKVRHDDRIKASGTGTGLVLEQDLSIKFGTFSVGQDAVGAETRVLPLTVKNKTGSQKSCDIQIEALDGDNSRVASQSVPVANLKGGEVRHLEAFGYVDSETTEQLKTATFRVAQAKCS